MGNNQGLWGWPWHSFGFLTFFLPQTETVCHSSRRASKLICIQTPPFWEIKPAQNTPQYILKCIFWRATEVTISKNLWSAKGESALRGFLTRASRILINHFQMLFTSLLMATFWHKISPYACLPHCELTGDECCSVCCRMCCCVLNLILHFLSNVSWTILIGHVPQIWRLSSPQEILFHILWIFRLSSPKLLDFHWSETM